MRRAWVIGIVLVALSGPAWASISTTVTTIKAYQSDVFSYNSSVWWAETRLMTLQATALGGQGDTPGTAQELTTGDVCAARTAIAASRWTYVAGLTEAGINTVTSGNYSIELFQDGASKGTLYVKQVTPVLITVEGCQLRWEIGPQSEPNKSYRFVVTTVV